MIVLSVMYLELLGLERGVDPVTSFNSVRLLALSIRSTKSQLYYAGHHSQFNWRHRRRPSRLHV